MPQSVSTRFAVAPFMEVDATAVLRRISLRLIPFLFLLYIFAYLDRVNVGYAALAIRRELHFSNTVYGTGAGLFFLSYALFEVPSNLVLLRVGPRRWIGTLLIAWGAISAGMTLVHSPTAFYLLRFLLGAAEAGFFPGIVLYLTHWFPQAARARAVARFMTATAIAGVVGAPFSSALLRLDGVAGIAGWQWLFVGEGVPAILLGMLVFRVLPDSPDAVAWLRSDERSWLAATIAAEQASRSGSHVSSFRDACRHSAIWRLALIYFCIQVSVYGINLWLPIILHRLSGAPDVRVVAWTAVPYLFATVAMLLVAGSSDRTQERRWHLAACLASIMLGFVLSVIFANRFAAMAGLFLAIAGTLATYGPFWTLPTNMLRGTAAAGGIALINSVGALGGFCGAYWMGRISDLTHSFRPALLMIAGLQVGAFFLVLTLRSRERSLES
jgi:ACS family tartrate transporter-like MFS transporter